MKMHSSFFNYNIQRPYPFKWFSPVAVVGGIILLVLLSILNFVQNSYQLVVEYVDDPNSTITNGVWFNHWPSYLTSSVQPTCEPASLPINAQFYTNQTGLMWTITSIFEDNEHAEALPSLPYFNNRLEHCEIRGLQLLLDGSADQDMATLFRGISWNVQARPLVTCAMFCPAGRLKINLTANYDLGSPYLQSGITDFVATNAKSRASMYWAQQLLSYFWLRLSLRMGEAAQSFRPNLTKGILNFLRTAEEDITQMDFFRLTFAFVINNEAPVHQYAVFIPDSLENLIQNTHSSNGSFAPNIWGLADTFAKAMYSAMLTDLGQSQIPARSNIVTDEKALEYFSANFSKSYTLGNWALAGKRRVYESFRERQKGSNPTGPLGVTPSVITIKYLCQVPKRKPIGNIFIAVLLADLVLLQAAWQLYTFGVGQFLQRTDEHSSYCEGCYVEIEKDNEDSVKEFAAARQRVRGHSSSNNIISLMRSRTAPS